MSEKTAENPRAFVRFGDYQKVIQSLRNALRIQTKDGTVRRGDGTNVRFNVPISERSFAATGSATSITLNAGFVSLASRQYYFPKKTYQGGGTGGVFLRVHCNFDVTPVFDGSDEKPWRITIVEDEAKPPALLWNRLSFVGQHARIRNPPDTPDTGIENYTLSIDSGIVYIPIAAWNGSEVVSFLRGNITLAFSDTGRLVYQSYGLI